MRAITVGFLAGSLVTSFLLMIHRKISTKRDTTKDDDDAEEEEYRKLQALAQSSAASSKKNTNAAAILFRKKDKLAASSSFLTSIVHELWEYLNVAGGDKIRAAVEPSFAESLPAPLNSLRFAKIDLGTNPIRMDNVEVKQITKDGMVQVVMDMVWNGNCDIQLQADSYIGGLAFGVKNIKLSGHFSLWFRPLTNALPVIAGIQYAFINPPYLDLKFTGLAAVADMAYIDKAVRNVIASSLLVVVLPNKGLYKMQTGCNFLDAYQPPLGVCAITAVQSRGFITEKKLIGKDDIPDVYLNITLGTSAVWRTTTIHDNLAPIWNESKDFVLHDQMQKITIHAWDEDKGPLDPDDDLGYASALVGEVLLQPSRQLELELLHSQTHKKTDAYCTIQCDVLRWTTDLSSINNGDSKQVLGLLVVIINRGFNIPLERKQAASFVKMIYNKKEYQSATILDYAGVDALNPLYETSFEIPIVAGMPTSGDDARIVLQLFNATFATKDNKAENSMLGSLNFDMNLLKLADENDDHTITETRLIGECGASIEYRVSLSGVDRTASTRSSKTLRHHPPGVSPARLLPSARKKDVANGVVRKLDYGDEDEQAPTIGTVSISVIQARGLTIKQELFNIDVPDAYCRIQFGASPEVWKTSVHSNSCTPKWNESKEYPLQDHSQVISLEMWDENERSFDPDIEVGSAKTTVGKILLAGGGMELELKRQGLLTGVFVTLRCKMVDE